MTATQQGARTGRPIHDVAAAVAGVVAAGTVSRVLNGGHYVSPPRCAAVQRADRRDRLRGQPARPQPGHPALRLGGVRALRAAGAALRGPELQRPAARRHPAAGRARHHAGDDDRRRRRRPRAGRPLRARRPRRRRAAGLHPRGRPAARRAARRSAIPVVACGAAARPRAATIPYVGRRRPRRRPADGAVPASSRAAGRSP